MCSIQSIKSKIIPRYANAIKQSNPFIKRNLDMPEEEEGKGQRSFPANGSLSTKKGSGEKLPPLSVSHQGSERKRLKRNGKAVKLKVEEVALGIASGAAGGDVGAAGLLDGDGDCSRNVSQKPSSIK